MTGTTAPAPTGPQERSFPVQDLLARYDAHIADLTRRALIAESKLEAAEAEVIQLRAAAG